MREKTASTEVYEGLKVGTRHFADDLEFGDLKGYLSPAAVPSAIAYFQARRDAELGRWRWPENPEWVVYPKRPGFQAYNGADLLVINELHGSSMEYSRALDDGTEYVADDEKPARAARAYFEAHPTRKPWEEATEGDIWALTFEAGSTSAWVRGEGYWHLPDNPKAKLHLGFSIVDGRRIWPEAAA